MTCVDQKTLSLVLLSTNPTRGASFLIALGGNFSHVCPVLLLDVRIVVLFVRTTPCELNPSPVAVAFQMEINAHRRSIPESKAQVEFGGL
jgi:hypothetical protein